LVSFVVYVFIACVGSWIVSITLNNSNNFHFVQRTSIHELSFDSEPLKKVTSSLQDIIPKKFNCTSIELQGGVRSKQSLEAFLRHKRPSEQKFVPSPRNKFMKFLKRQKTLLQLTFFSNFCHFAITTKQASKTRKRKTYTS